MDNEVKLSSVLQDPRKASFITPYQITLNYCDIHLIEKIPNRFLTITKLFLSHNKISSLSGIEQFKALTHLSIGYNQIDDWRELNKILNKENLKYLSIQGNPLEKHPNHKMLILDLFPNLEKLDNMKADSNARILIEKKTGIIQKNLITFLYYLFDEINNLEILLGKLKISNELKSLKLQEINKNQEINPQTKLNEFLDSDKNLMRFKKLFNFQRIEELKQFLHSKKFSLRTDFFSMLSNISEIILKLYGSFDNIVINNRQAFFTIYKCLYIELIEKLNQRIDKNLEHFLVIKVLANDLICKEKFTEDDDYALDCMLSTFYQLLPTQAFISNVICYDRKNELLSPSKEYFQVNDNFHEKGFSNLSPDNLSNRIYKWEHGKEIWKYKRNEMINNLEINENNPENIKNVLLVHFPIFPLNKNYMESLLEILNNKFQLLLNFYSNILEILGVPKIIKHPNCHANDRTIQNQMDNNFLEKSLEGFRSNQETMRNNSNENKKVLEDKEINTNENWNKSETIKIRKLEQNNQIFSVNKLQNKKEQNLKNKTQKHVSLKKSIVKKTHQETETNFNFPPNNQENIKKMKQNVVNLVSKILQGRTRDKLKSCFETLKNACKLQKKEKKQLLAKKKKGLEKLCQHLKNLIKITQQKLKQKSFQNLKKHLKKLQKCSILRNIKQRRIFNILYENFAHKREEFAEYHCKMLKYKVFFHFLKLLYNKKKMKDSIKHLIDIYRKKNLKSVLNQWKDYNEQKKLTAKNNYSSFKDNNSKAYSFTDNNYTKENLYNESNYYSRTTDLGKSKNLFINKPKTCKCQHYFRKCGACLANDFN